MRDNSIYPPPPPPRWSVTKKELLALPEHEYDSRLHRIEKAYQMCVSVHKIKNSRILKATLFDKSGTAQAIIFCDREIERDITYLPPSARWSRTMVKNSTEDI